MTVSIILGRKGRDVETTRPEQTLGEVVKTLGAKKIGAVVVTSQERRVLGIVSERDIIRVMASHGAAVLTEPVSSHMTRTVVTAEESTSVLQALGRMTEGRFRHMPVTEDDRLVGIVSIGDLVKHRLSEMETENQAMLEYIAAT